MIEKLLRDVVRDAVIEALSAVIETHAPRFAAVAPTAPCAGHAVESDKDEAAEKKPARAKKEKPAAEAPGAPAIASEAAPPADTTPAPLPAPAAAPSTVTESPVDADRRAMREIIAKLPGGVKTARTEIAKYGPQFDALTDADRAAVLAELRAIAEAGF